MSQRNQTKLSNGKYDARFAKEIAEQCIFSFTKYTYLNERDIRHEERKSPENLAEAINLLRNSENI
jgi:hypothetical protein